MDAQTTATVAAWGAGAAAFMSGAYGWLQQRRANRAEEKATQVSKSNAADLSKSAQDLADSYKAMADEWKERYEAEKKTKDDYTTFVHAKNERDNKIMLNLTEENATLRARTDLKPLMDHMEQQSAALAKLTAAIETLIDRLNKDKT